MFLKKVLASKHQTLAGEVLPLGVKIPKEDLAPLREIAKKAGVKDYKAGFDEDDGASIEGTDPEGVTWKIYNVGTDDVPRFTVEYPPNDFVFDVQPEKHAVNFLKGIFA